MAGTFSQIYIQLVFAVKGRESVLHEDWREDLFKYMAAIIKGKEQKSIIVNGMADHVHAFVGLRPAMPIADLVRDLKNNSSKYINDRKLVKGRFVWQEGYGAFSYGQSQVEAVYQYILHQKEHHRKRTFKEEYIGFMQKFQIEYDERYLFDWIEDS